KDIDVKPVLFLLAAAVGIFGGIGAVLFKQATDLAQAFLVGNKPSFLEASLRLPWYLKLAVPAVGGLLAGLILFFLPKEAKGHGVSEIMEAVTIRGGILNLRAALVRSFSSLMSIGSGSSIGREGPIVQMAAAFASKIGQILQIRRENLSILVGCGVAAGLAAAYNAPIAASFFVMEIIIGNFATDIFAPLVVSSVLSTLVYRKLFGNEPVYGTPHFTLSSEWELLIYVLLGVLAGVVAAMFRTTLAICEKQFNRIRGPIAVKSLTGGILIGIIGLFWPHVWGNGFDAINIILDNGMSWNLLFILFGIKMLATGISVGSGASGGVFTPAQFIGAALGGFIGFAAYKLFPQHVALPSAYALVGMGCLTAGTTYAPIMAILMIFEMTLDYEIILPLMLSCIISSTVARHFHRDSIYAEKLRLKGIRMDATLEESAMRALRVSDIQRTDAPTILENQRFNEVIHQLLKARSNVLYVVNNAGKLLGSIDIHDLKEFFNEKDLYSLVLARDVATPT
ncbi:MAG TPA: ClcB-like voltage-gated chloride channel protein, partial [Acidobacteriota bacterium]